MSFFKHLGHCYGNAAVGGSGCLFHREAPDQDRQLGATNVAQPDLAQQMKQRGTAQPGVRGPLKKDRGKQPDTERENNNQTGLLGYFMVCSQQSELSF